MTDRKKHENKEVKDLSVPLERDGFMRTLIRELSGTLQDVVGIDEASGFISVVGQNMGSQINDDYRNALQVENLDRQQVGEVLVDLKKRINGDFYIVEENDEKIVLHNRVCPFEDRVKDRPAMCMMTSNVFGFITAENLGYSKVELNETIAAGDGRCVVTIYLQPTHEATRSYGREYFKGAN
jgi:predicted ArsR family transcriptional regulator